MSKYIYISDFLSKRLKNDEIVLLKKNFLEVNNSKNLDIIKLGVTKTLDNLPKIISEDEHINQLLKENRYNEELINVFSKDILKKDFSDFIKKPESIEELIVFAISQTLNDIYIENQDELMLDNISGFEPVYQKKKCDLIISNSFLQKYLIIIKRVILFEELNFIKEFETKTDKLSKSDLKKAKQGYDSIIRLIEEFRISLESLSLDFPEMRAKFIREHMLTDKSRPIIELSKEVEKNNQNIIDELKKIAKNARNRKEFILKELDEKQINWPKIKKKFIEQKILRLN